MVIKKVGMNKVTTKVNRKNDTEFGEELTGSREKLSPPMEGKKSKLTERPANYEIYPGE